MKKIDDPPWESDSRVSTSKGDWILLAHAVEFIALTWLSRHGIEFSHDDLLSAAQERAVNVEFPLENWQFDDSHIVVRALDDAAYAICNACWGGRIDAEGTVWLNLNPKLGRASATHAKLGPEWFTAVYGRDFGRTSLFDWPANSILRSLPTRKGPSDIIGEATFVRLRRAQISEVFGLKDSSMANQNVQRSGRPKKQAWGPLIDAIVSRQISGPPFRTKTEMTQWAEHWLSQHSKDGEQPLQRSVIAAWVSKRWQDSKN